MGRAMESFTTSTHSPCLLTTGIKDQSTDQYSCDHYIDIFVCTLLLRNFSLVPSHVTLPPSSHTHPLPPSPNHHLPPYLIPPPSHPSPYPPSPRVPQSLLYLGVLCYSDELMGRLVKGEHVEVGSVEEVEIRGCSIWAVEVRACTCACVCVCGYVVFYFFPH